MQKIAENLFVRFLFLLKQVNMGRLAKIHLHPPPLCQTGSGFPVAIFALFFTCSQGFDKNRLAKNPELKVERGTEGGGGFIRKGRGVRDFFKL